MSEPTSESSTPCTTDVAGCPACPHPLPAHDVIGNRFCRATTANALSRGCVCATK